MPQAWSAVKKQRQRAGRVLLLSTTLSTLLSTPPLRHSRALASLFSPINHTGQPTEDDEVPITMATTASCDHNPHLIRRGSSSVAVGGPSPSLTVTKNFNGSAAVSEEHRVQASDYLASYIKVPNASCLCQYSSRHFVVLFHAVAVVPRRTLVLPTPRINARSRTVPWCRK